MGDAYRNIVDLTLAFDQGQVSIDHLSEAGLGQLHMRSILVVLTGDISLNISDRPISSDRLSQKTQRAKTIAENLRLKGFDEDRWNEASQKLETALRSIPN
jgi:hypothetical protein